MSGCNLVVPEWANEEFTLYIGHVFKHVPMKMIFSVFRKMGLGMLIRGHGAIVFKEYDNRKSVKINFKHLFTRGPDAEKNITILKHLREGGNDAHFELTYQESRFNEKSGKDDPARFWKVSLWRDRNRTNSPRESDESGSSDITISLSGGSLGKSKKVVKRKIKLIAAGLSSSTKSGPSIGENLETHRRTNPPPLDLSGIDLGWGAPYNQTSPRYIAMSPNYMPSPSYLPVSPDYVPSPPPASAASARDETVNGPCAEASHTTNLKCESHAPVEHSLPLCNDDEHRVDDTTMHEDDKNVIFVEENNRRKGSAVWYRYEKYKTATTINEARQLGATGADIKKDFDKGWCLRK